MKSSPRPNHIEPHRCRCLTSRIDALRHRLHRVPVLGQMLFVLIGFLALVWFLIRVVPKPQRASYPCQRVAMPLASSFVLWLLGLVASAKLFRAAAARMSYRRVMAALLLGTTAAVVFVIAQGQMPGGEAVAAPPHAPGNPLGTGRGVHPGRVVWVHDPDATDWDGPGCGARQYETNCTDTALVEQMFTHGIHMLAGETNTVTAWSALFTKLNEQLGRGTNGYQSGETIAIKINFTTCYGAATPGSVDATTWEQTGYLDQSAPSPALTVALLDHLVNTVGVNQSDIIIGDPTAFMPKYYYEWLHDRFPNIVYLDYLGGPDDYNGGPSDDRTPVSFGSIPFGWSTPDAAGKTADFLPTYFGEADYLINFAILKSHERGGVTLCAKNHYGSLFRKPTAAGYLNLHEYLPQLGPQNPGTPGMGHYRALVDLMGHRDLGGKTVLYLIDGLFGGDDWSSTPSRWSIPPFNDDWPSSLFISQDPVAIDSVGYDFVLQQWPERINNPELGGGATDFLVEAALADNPPSGTFYDPEGDGTNMVSLGVHEHWNNVVDKQYSRNLGAEEGIELVGIDSYGQPLKESLLYIDAENAGIDVWSIDATPMQQYQVLRSPTLVDPLWQTAGVFRATSSATNWIDTSGDDQAFYRLQRIQEAVAPILTVYPQSATVMEGEAAVFSAAALGFPAPSYQWYMNGAPVGTGGPVYSIDPVLLSNNGASIYAVAYNDGGSDASGVATLTVIPLPTDPPEAPSALVATVQNASSIALSWTDNADNESAFVIERATTGGLFLAVATLPANTVSYTDTGLDPATEYIYRIRATNIVSDSAWSNQDSATTPLVVISADLGNNIALASPDAAGVVPAAEWTNPTGFPNFTDKPLNFSDATASGATLTMANATANVTTLIGIDGGDINTTMFNRGARLSSSGTTLTLNSLPTTEAWAGGYDIYLYLATYTGDPATLSITDGATTYYLNLPAGANYSGTFVQSISTSGTSPSTSGNYVRFSGLSGASQTFTLTCGSGLLTAVSGMQIVNTPPPVTAAPVAPASLVATATATHTIDLNWADTWGEYGFIIERGPDIGSLVAIATNAANKTAYSDTGLTESTEYWYRVSAFNGFGVSTGNQVTSSTTLVPSLPVAPSSLTAMAVSTNEVDLSWADTLGEDAFIIERGPDTNSLVAVATNAANDTTYSDTGLAESTKYWYRVSACNALGTSSNNPVASATTPQGDPVEVKSAATPPTIDGNPGDACWADTEWQSISQTWLPFGETVPEADYSGRYKIAWSDTENVIYFLVEIVDDVFVDGYVYPESDYPNYDVLEVFIDEDKSGGPHVFDTATENAENAFSYHITVNAPADGETTTNCVACDIAGTGWSTEIIRDYASHLKQFAMKKSGTTYHWEFSLAVYNDSYVNDDPEASRVQLTADKILGLSVAYCDNDDPNEDPKTRDNFFGSVIVTEETSNDHWMQADGFGSALLTNP